jgi:hypothetical protein
MNSASGPLWVLDYSMHISLKVYMCAIGIAENDFC